MCANRGELHDSEIYPDKVTKKMPTKTTFTDSNKKLLHTTFAAENYTLNIWPSSYLTNTLQNNIQGSNNRTLRSLNFKPFTPVTTSRPTRSIRLQLWP